MVKLILIKEIYRYNIMDHCQVYLKNKMVQANQVKNSILSEILYNIMLQMLQT